MCLLLNYPLAHLHVAMKRAMDDCGKTINHYFLQSRGGAKKTRKKKRNKPKNPQPYPFSLLSMWETRKLRNKHHP